MMGNRKSLDAADDRPVGEDYREALMLVDSKV
jgi:hypothetical protein